MINKPLLKQASGLALIVSCFLAEPSAFGEITYTLHLGTSAEELQISNSVVTAAALYNQSGSFNKHWDVNYDPNPNTTANANYNGVMHFGTQRSVRTVMHEAAHTFGMGTYGAYSGLLSGGVWQGTYGNQAQFDTYNDYGDGLHGDGHAIWPGGFNYESEDGTIERLWHIRIMAGIRCDMGILAFSREAENELVHFGETAEFHVASPVATSFQWYKGGVALSNGGDISGATSATLQIANAQVIDQGSYYCRVAGASENLNSRARTLWVSPIQQLGQWDMDGNTVDSLNGNNGTPFGSPTYVPGVSGQAMDLDGVDDYVALPSAAVKAKDITVATWVNWDGGDDWQRVFDFGTGIHQNLFLTPRSGDGTLRLALKDSINGVDSEKQINATVLPAGQWVHVTAVLNGDYATLYVNGQAVGSVFDVDIDPTDFQPTQNYIGKSQYPDSLFDGRIDDFRIYNYALTGAEVWELWGQNPNAAPVFTADPIALPDAVDGVAYTGQTLATHASDGEGDMLTYSKLDGPAWLSVSGSGSVSGTPGTGDTGPNTFIVRVQDPSGASSDAVLLVNVQAAPIDFEAGPLAHWDFNDSALGATNGAAMPDSDGSTVWREAATDKSGYGNHLTTWEYGWAGFTWSTNGVQGDYSILAAGTYPAAFTWSAQSHPNIADVEELVLTNFTVEALFTVSGTTGYSTAVGRDGQNVTPGSLSSSILYFGVNPSNNPLINYADVAGQRHVLVAPNTLVPTDNAVYATDPDAATWYHLAGVCDGTTLSLYLNGALVASMNVSGASSNPAMTDGSGGIAGGGDWHAGGWSVARSLFNGAHEDRWYGYIDEVAISGTALDTNSFVISGYDVWLLSKGIPRAPFDGDADTNGVLNGVEYFLGANPTNPASPARILRWSGDLLSVSYPYNPAASDVTGIVEWTTNLAAGDWTESGVTYATNTSPNEIEATFATSIAEEMYVRLKVVR